MERLDDRARDALAEYQASLGPTGDEAREVWKSIRARAEQEPLDAAAVAEDARTESDERPAVWRWTAGLGLLAAAAAAVVLVGLSQRAEPEGASRGDLQSVDVDAREPASAEATAVELRSTRTPEPTRTSEQTLVAESADPQAEASPESAAETKSTDRKRRRAPATTPVPVPELDPLEEIRAEAGLLERARADLAAGRHGTVLELVAQHRRSFAGGTMSEEFAILELQALCSREDGQRWSAALERFERRHPKSPLRVHLRQDCGQ